MAPTSSHVKVDPAEGHATKPAAEDVQQRNENENESDGQNIKPATFHRPFFYLLRNGLGAGQEDESHHPFFHLLRNGPGAGQQDEFELRLKPRNGLQINNHSYLHI